jgi:hypothetical protein
VTRMTGNGADFGIGVSGLKGEWFIGPVELSNGVYFKGYNQQDAIVDLVTLLSPRRSDLAAMHWRLLLP